MTANFIEVTGTVLRTVDTDFAYVALDANASGKHIAIARNEDCIELPACGWLGKQFNKVFEALHPYEINNKLWRNSNLDDLRRAPKAGDRVYGEIDLSDSKTDLIRNVTIRPR